jgi:hypothetical protein
MWKILIKWLRRLRKNWPERKVKEAEVEVKEEAKIFPRTGYISLRMKKINLTLTLKEEEVYKEDNMPT